jgi:16S rRNA pseudouridine516 synthase
MQIQELLFSQGFGTRRICQGLVEQGHVRFQSNVEWMPPIDPWEEIDTFEGMPFEVMGKSWQYWTRAYVLLHKPAGTECSQKPSSWPSIYTLLPSPLRQRPQKSAIQGVQAVGRLDQDTTGMLLLTDDGAFIHRLSSPKHHVPKVYDITTENVLTQKALDQLLTGVVLNDSPKPVRAEHIEQTGERTLKMTLTQGKYHQVKRMLASVGHLVVALHRSQMGSLVLPIDLAPGQWRYLSTEEVLTLQGGK